MGCDCQISMNVAIRLYFRLIFVQFSLIVLCLYARRPLKLSVTALLSSLLKCIFDNPRS